MTNDCDAVYHKYEVTRMDGKLVQWCFVLEPDDPWARVALMVYAKLARKGGKATLAEDIEQELSPSERKTALSDLAALEAEPLAVVEAMIEPEDIEHLKAGDILLPLGSPLDPRPNEVPVNVTITERPVDA